VAAVLVELEVTAPNQTAVVQVESDSHLTFPDHLQIMQVVVVAPFRDPACRPELELLVAVPVVLQALGLRLRSIPAAAVVVPLVGLM
jgi:hypothetical protein